MRNKDDHNTQTHKPQYRDQEAQDNQEVVTPPGLVEHIYKKCLEIDPDMFKGKVLDPAVGPGALVHPLIEKHQELGITELTVMDIQEKHIKDFKDKYDNRK